MKWVIKVTDNQNFIVQSNSFDAGGKYTISSYIHLVSPHYDFVALQCVVSLQIRCHAPDCLSGCAEESDKQVTAT